MVLHDINNLQCDCMDWDVKPMIILKKICNVHYVGVLDQDPYLLKNSSSPKQLYVNIFYSAFIASKI